jgi:glycosyltransferase involved in cell wall biosynthesis
VINFVGVMPGASIADGGSRLGLTVRRLADRLTASRVDAYVAVASTVAQALIADGAPATRMHTIPNSIDIDALLGLATGPTPPLPPGRPLVVCAARLEVVKGVEYLVRAAADVPQAAFAITGTGPLDEQLRELSVTLGVDERVAFLGRVPEVAPVLAAADIVVLPSLSEGLPTVAVEAMALGKPVVATRVGGTPEAVEDGVTGLLVEPRDPAALAAAIMRLADDPVLARTLGEAGAARARERFSAAAMVDSYAALIAELVASPRR